MPVIRRSPKGGVERVVFCFHLSSIFEQALGHFDVPHASGHVKRGHVVLRPEGRQSGRDNIKAELVTFAGTMYIFPTPLPTVALLLRGKARPNWIKNEVARSALLQGKKGSTEQPSPPLTPQKATATITLLCCTLVQRAMLYSRIESEDKKKGEASRHLVARLYVGVEVDQPRNDVEVTLEQRRGGGGIRQVCRACCYRKDEQRYVERRYPTRHATPF